MFPTISKMMALLDSRVKRSLLVLMLPMMVTSILEMVSVGMILPIVGGLIEDDGGRYYRFFIDKVAVVDKADFVLFALLAMAVAVVVKNALYLYSYHMVNRTIALQKSLFMRRLFVMYLNMPYEYYFTKSSADLIRNISLSSAKIFDGIRIVLVIVLEIVFALAVVAILLIAEPVAASSMLVLFVLIGGAIYKLISSKIAELGANAHAAESRVLHWVRYSFDAIKDVQANSLYQYLGDFFERHSNRIAVSSYKLATLNIVPRILFETILIVLFAALMGWLIFSNRPHDEIIGLAALFGMAALRLLPSLNRILTNAAELRSRTAPVDDICDDMALGTREQARMSSMYDTSKTLSFPQEIVLRDLCYRYPGKDVDAVKNVTLTIRRGERIGLIGSSGAGKTTLVDLLLGLIHPTSGDFLLDELKASQVIPQWRDMVGYVPQHIFLNDDTLRRNIALGVQDERIDDTMLKAALEQSQLRDVADKLPDGLDTLIGENGIRLSGGQRQRIGIARVLYHNPELLIFDEATSALDNETEKQISSAINNLPQSKTLILIAHRLSTVQKCDRLVLMQDGGIADIGTYDELLSRNAVFQRLVEFGEFK